MNKIYNIVWNAARNAWLVTHEAAGSHGHPMRKVASALAIAMLAGPVLAATPASDALPTGGNVVSGQANITQSGSQMVINQSTDKTIINWNTFNIGSQASVTFQQPTATSVALNRVISSDPSAIFGTLQANGQVFLVNPNGVLFGQGAKVDVQGLVASTMNISDADFNAGNYVFNRLGATGSVVNEGEILAKYVAMLAPEVVNNGVILAPMGRVVMAAGESVTLGITGQDLVGVLVDKATIDTLVENKGLVQVDGGTVIMSAQAAATLLGEVVNTGKISADSMTADGGVIQLRASSIISNSGEITANAGTGGNGGTITAISDLDNPNGTTYVDGIWSAQGGTQWGDGGFIETSGHHLKVASSASISTRAANGKTGTWLLDPYDFTVAASGGDITGADLSNELINNSITIQTTAGGVSCTGLLNVSCGTGNSAGNGDIFINDAIAWDGSAAGGTTLTLQAYRNIEINAAINAGNGNPMSGDGISLDYGIGVSGGYAVIAQGVTVTSATPIVDTPHSAAVNTATIDTSTAPYYFGSGAGAGGGAGGGSTLVYVGLNGTLSSTYGDTPTYSLVYYDAASNGNVLSLSNVMGMVSWTAPLDNTSSVNTYSLTYAGGLSLSGYSFQPLASSINWNVLQRSITLAATPVTKVVGATDPQLSVTVNSGSLAAIDGLADVTGTLSRQAGETAGAYNILLGSGTRTANYAITFNANNGAFTITDPPKQTGGSEGTNSSNANNSGGGNSNQNKGNGGSNAGGQQNPSSPTQITNAESGDITSKTLSTTITNVSGKMRTMYIAAVLPASLGGGVYLWNGSSWVAYDPANPASCGTLAPGETAKQDYVSKTDMSSIVGTKVYVGTGSGTTAFGVTAPWNDMLSNGTYDLSYTVQ